ncbi:helix-turn-helix domain-containing protein [Aquimarina megaterium]|uniref:helix-turn-helix domain-containing protein n=1 Tax=Aquimarina megaterium TaxID=1443666 RepID=UPI00047199A8|nr:AraC family transcriptional regulator [Aquimarina megaterium]
MKQEEFVTHKPQDSFLQDYISYYYFHCSADSLLQKRFMYYPNSKNALTIYRNSKVTYSCNYSKTVPDTKTDFSFLYSGVQKQCRIAEILAPFDKIGIVFRETGINHFIKVPLSNISGDPIEKSFTYFGDDLKKCCESVYAEKSIENKVTLLDQFFEDKFCDFKEEVLKKCIHIILESSEKLTVKELSEELNVSRKTLLRLFNKHMCCTVKEYIDIIQFRKSLNDYLLKNNNAPLTEIALKNEYYDQSQFINHFKKLTGFNPKSFFKNVKHLGEEDTFWTFK